MVASTREIFVILKDTGCNAHGEHDVRVHAAYDTRLAAERRIRIIAKKNRPYLLRKLGDNSWVIGPEEDEGIFGDKPVYLRIIETILQGEGAHEHDHG